MGHQSTIGNEKRHFSCSPRVLLEKKENRPPSLFPFWAFLLGKPGHFSSFLILLLIFLLKSSLLPLRASETTEFKQEEAPVCPVHHRFFHGIVYCTENRFDPLMGFWVCGDSCDKLCEDENRRKMRESECHAHRRQSTAPSPKKYVGRVRDVVHDVAPFHILSVADMIRRGWFRVGLHILGSCFGRGQVHSLN